MKLNKRTNNKYEKHGTRSTSLFTAGIYREPAFHELENVVTTLNTEDDRSAEQRAELRRLVERWKESGPNVWQMLHNQEPALGRRVMAHTETLLAPTEGGNAELYWKALPADFDIHSKKDRALANFMKLITHPQWRRLAGPCPRCGNYYLKNSAHRKVYCSRSCGSSDTAAVATRKRRAVELNEKLRRVKRAIESWEARPKKRDPKEWIAANAGVTTRWLTRIENKELIRLPKTPRP